MYVCQKYCLLVATSLKTNVAHNDSCAIVLVTFSVFQLHEQVLWLQVFSNLTACQALGNMCVMNMHSFSGMSTDACGLFNTIFRSRAALSSTQDISYW